MKRTTLRPDQIAWLTATFSRNRAAFGGARMMADGDDGQGDADKPGEKGDHDADKSGGKPDASLGEGGKRALEAERQARKDAEDQVKALKGEFDGFKTALTEALGIKPKDGDKSDDALSAVQEQLAAMQRESSVLKLANAHKITDEKDLELLATAKDADSMRRLAERLAPAEEERDATSRRRPKPDKGQGGGDGTGGGKSVAQVMAERAAARDARNKN